MDTFALGLLKAAAIIEDGRIEDFIKNKYSSFNNTEIGKRILSGSATLTELAAHAEALGDTKSVESGRQEYLESVMNSILFS
jgi:xylose isomerase